MWIFLFFCMVRAFWAEVVGIWVKGWLKGNPKVELSGEVLRGLYFILPGPFLYILNGCKNVPFLPPDNFFILGSKCWGSYANCPIEVSVFILPDSSNVVQNPLLHMQVTCIFIICHGRLALLLLRVKSWSDLWCSKFHVRIKCIHLRY